MKLELELVSLSLTTAFLSDATDKTHSSKFRAEKQEEGNWSVCGVKTSLLSIEKYLLNNVSQSSGGNAQPKIPMTQQDASRIQSSEAKQHGGGVPEGSFASRAESTADKRANQNNRTCGTQWILKLFLFRLLVKYV